MKKFFFSVLFVTLSLASWFSSRPDWITTHKKFSFVGISSPKETRQEATKDATINALSQVSNSLGVVVNSNFSSSKAINSGQISKNNTQSDIKLESFSKIENYEIKKSYCEERDDKIICYVLLSFEKEQFLKLQKETKKRIKKLNNLINELEIAIRNFNYNEAKSLYQKASLIPESNYNLKFQKLKKEFLKMINLKVSDISKEISPLEDIKFSLISNKDGFLYVIYNNGLFPKVIFPQNEENNKIEKDKVFTLPLRYKYNSNKNQRLLIIFSKNRITIPTDSSYKIDKYQTLWKQQLKTEINTLNAVVKRFNFKLKKVSKSLCVKGDNNPISQAVVDKSAEVFRNLGMRISCDNYDYLIKIKTKKEKYYAEERYSYLYDITFNFILEDNFIGEIDNISIKETFYATPDNEIADSIKQESLNEISDDFKLDNIYKTIKGEK